MKIVSVNWHDAWSHDEQCDIELAKTLCAKQLHVVSIGYLIEENEDCIIICRDWIVDEDHASGIIHIPKGWVETVTVLTEEEEETKQ